jgi:HD-GYP domain-containing protein (c-di-GMP phosphodiesterase class II)/CHASE2 domain-containing sensor protein
LAPLVSRIGRGIPPALGTAALQAAAIALVAFVFVATGWLAAVERPARDALLRLASRLPPESVQGVPDVAVVAIDPPSLRAHPAWPWPRSLHAEAVDRLTAAGAVAIAFDVDFSTARAPEEDGHLAAALRRSGRALLAGFRQVERFPNGAELEIASLPAPTLREAAAGIGSVHAIADPDGVVRRVPRATAIAGEPVASLAQSALALTRGETAATELERPLVVDYRRASPAFPVLSMQDVLAGRFDPRDVAGRVVFVGATAAEFQDLWTTPLGPAQPGVFVQALAYRTLTAEAAGAALREADPFERAALAGFLSAAAAALGLRSHRRRALGLAALALASGAAITTLLVHGGVQADPVLPGLVLAAHYALGLETVRRRFGRGLARRELALATLFRVGEATADPTRLGGLDLSLALLGDVVDASGVALLRAGADGALDGRRVEWRRSGPSEIGHFATAERALARRELCVVESRAPATLTVYLPLFAGASPVGVLVVERAGGGALADTELRTIATVGAQLALSADHLRLLGDLRRTFDASVEALASAVEARDGYTESHCRRLAIFSTSMAARLGLPEPEIEEIRLGALLHDVGKIGIRDEVLLKPGLFTPGDRLEIERHAEIGHRIIAPISGLGATTIACVRHHHERWDGTGYPDRLAGQDIPIGARIVAIVDVWDALSTARPYKPALPQPEVRSLLAKGRGSHFDPELVDLFLRVLDEDGEEMLALVGAPSARE